MCCKLVFHQKLKFTHKIPSKQNIKQIVKFSVDYLSIFQCQATVIRFTNDKDYNNCAATTNLGNLCEGPIRTSHVPATTKKISRLFEKKKFFLHFLHYFEKLALC